MSIPIRQIPLTALRPSPTNPRTTVDAASIQEIASSILQHGIIQPILVREMSKGPLMEQFGLAEPTDHSGEEPRFEIVFGFQRWTAAQEALKRAETECPEAIEHLDLTNAPCMVRELTDRQVVEMQIIENLQRRDVSPKDEAFGYARLLDMRDEKGDAIYTLEKIADAIGKKKTHVSDRLKLRYVPEELWEALAQGQVFISHLEAVGGIPHEKARKEAAKRILKPEYSGHPMSVKQAVEMIESDYRVSLKGCGFALDDAELVPVESKDGVRIMGGACIKCEKDPEGCPHRTGNMPELQDQLQKPTGKKGGQQTGINPNLCCNTECFKAKQNAAFRVVKAHAETEGRTVFDVDKSSEVFASWSDGLQHGTPYVLVTESPDFTSTGHHGAEDLPAWEELLKDSDYMKHTIIARHPKTKRVHLLLDREQAIAMASANGHKKLFKERPEPVKPKDEKTLAKEQAAEERERQKRQLEYAEEGAFEKLFLRRAGAIVSGPRGISDEVWAVLARSLCICFSETYGDELRALAAYCGKALGENDDFGVDELAEVVAARVKKEPSFAREFLVVGLIVLEVSVSPGGNDFSELKTVGSLTKLLKIDQAALRKESRAAAESVIKRQKVEELKSLSEKRLTCKKGEIAELDEEIAALQKELGLPRPVSDYKCDTCGKELNVPPGKGEVAAGIPKGDMHCLDHGGDWEVWQKLGAIGDGASQKPDKTKPKTAAKTVAKKAGKKGGK